MRTCLLIFALLIGGATLRRAIKIQTRSPYCTIKRVRNLMTALLGKRSCHSPRYESMHGPSLQHFRESRDRAIERLSDRAIDWWKKCGDAGKEGNRRGSDVIFDSATVDRSRRWRPSDRRRQGRQRRDADSERSRAASFAVYSYRGFRKPQISNVTSPQCNRVTDSKYSYFMGLPISGARWYRTEGKEGTTWAVLSLGVLTTHLKSLRVSCSRSSESIFRETRNFYILWLVRGQTHNSHTYLRSFMFWLKIRPQINMWYRLQHTNCNVKHCNIKLLA